MPSPQEPIRIVRGNDVPATLVVMHMNVSDHLSQANGRYTTVPVPWPRGDGSWVHAYPLTIPRNADRDERCVFVYAEPGRLAPAVVHEWLARIYDGFSDPSLCVPWGTVIDL